ncbi:hypothetical protein PF002_g5709 [Phytophthora fragariae]|uniref:DUF659 domain-containing protein n=1 Tax=Phytophthora fragariae TaxID=53985 RepID=A0A6A4A5P5_9STRA|nr:hypothetical protein PF002_g5709 [Phytophthora fragariae]
MPNLDEAEQTKWRRFGEPPKKQRRKRKKRSTTRSPEATQESVMTISRMSQSQPTMSFVGNIGHKEKKRFQPAIARIFYAAGLPFRAIEVPRMRHALTSLQPDMERYLLPRKALAGHLLTEEYHLKKNELIARLRDEPIVGLVSDGWSSISKDMAAEEVGSVIDDINLAAGKSAVKSVTTDNAPVMQKAWEGLERERTLSCNGRSSHALNLILEEVLSVPWLESVFSKSVTLSK